MTTQGYFVKGLEQGIWKEFNERGEVVQSGSYIDGYKEGVWKEYDGKGNVIKQVSYKNGEPAQ